jgi:hypothetical protein
VLSNCEGTLRVLSDVMVQHGAGEDLIATSDEPRTCGQVLTIELISGNSVRIPVRVAQSRPIVEDGSIRHVLMLVRLEQDDRLATIGDDCS